MTWVCTLCGKLLKTAKEALEHKHKFVKYSVVINELKLARKCMQLKGFRCENKDCMNLLCPLHPRGIGLVRKEEEK